MNYLKTHWGGLVGKTLAYFVVVAGTIAILSIPTLAIVAIFKITGVI